MWQKRSLLCTNNRLINLDGYDVKRSIDIIKIKALTKNIKPHRTDDFLVHVKGEYDYHFKSDDREIVFKHI